MKRYLLALPLLALPIAACTPSEQNAAIGALGGAAVGAAVSSDSDRTKGAIAGAAVGVVASQLIGPAPQSGKCYYRDQYGNKYIANCT
ncbi:YtxH domain-containing protein [Tabrizicola sp.]|uniref:YtxH domain-containing protein n=1 Tax=Tabrizicola sp. TaxID=2005166 RepID=UPI001A61D554|nr:YtxH domain-containing protein [Tabrizicola sp.]MBL9073157.1 YtxH domain-containing protein [Tabrizicola sp.]